MEDQELIQEPHPQPEEQVRKIGSQVASDSVIEFLNNYYPSEDFFAQDITTWLKYATKYQCEKISIIAGFKLLENSHVNKAFVIVNEITDGQRFKRDPNPSRSNPGWPSHAYAIAQIDNHWMAISPANLSENVKTPGMLEPLIGDSLANLIDQICELEGGNWPSAQEIEANYTKLKNGNVPLDKNLAYLHHNVSGKPNAWDCYVFTIEELIQNQKQTPTS